jgi:hypothetical protein
MKSMSRKRRSRGSAAVAAELMLAPMVIGMRMPLLAAEVGQSLYHPGKETSRAFTEKTAAMMQGAMAANAAFAASAMRFWPELLSGRVPSLLNGIGAERAMLAAMRPAGRTVKANFGRLSRGPS